MSETIPKSRLDAQQLREEAAAFHLRADDAGRLSRRLIEAADTIEALSAQVEELTKERDDAIVAVDAFADICDELGCERDNEAGLMAAFNLKASLASVTAERDAMREALKPFAAVAERIAANHPGWDHDDFLLKVGSEPSKLGPYRRALSLTSGGSDA